MAQATQRVNASINPGFGSSLRIAALENAGFSVTPDPYTALNTSNTILVVNANVWPTLEPAMDLHRRQRDPVRAGGERG
jgi:hypothetical protein